jgi:hypothetical protein
MFRDSAESEIEERSFSITPEKRNKYKNIIYRKPEINQSGFFQIMKSIPLSQITSQDAVVNRRCDRGWYGPTGINWSPDSGTPYGTRVESIKYIMTEMRLIDYPSKFIFSYCEYGERAKDQNGIKHWKRRADLEYSEDYDGLYQLGAEARTIQEFFKNMREWSFMVDEPFSSTEPIAVYSKMFLDTISPPNSILDEIDSWPDMHLEKFLKGDTNARARNVDFPDISAEFRTWFDAIMDEFSDMTAT